MPQYEEIKNDENRLRIKVGIRCKEHPKGRIWKTGIYPGVKKGSKKANELERKLIGEAEKEKAIIQEFGTFWIKLVGLYELHAFDELKEGRWPQSRQTLSEAISSLRKWTSEWDDKLAAKITSADVTRLLNKMKAKGKAGSTLSKMRGDIKKVFEFGIIHELINGVSKSPTIGVSVASRRRKRTEILQAAEIKKLLVCAKEFEPNWYFIWSFAVYTGARVNELYALKWTDINEQERTITIQRGYSKKYKTYKDWTKNGDWRTVSICEPLQEVISELRARNTFEKSNTKKDFSDYVLPRPGMFQNWSQAEKTRLFCKEIGITPICFHTLRACFATELLKRGVPIPRVMRVGGWKSLKTMMHYVRLSGTDVTGTTDPLDFRGPEPDKKTEDQALMKAVGAEFDTRGMGIADVVDLSLYR